MNRQEALEKLLAVFERYYTINRETPEEPFAAEAVFSLHNENYFLIRSAKFAEQDSNEFVYFAETDELTPAIALELGETAWKRGLDRADPKPNHRNSDVSLFILADRILPECEAVLHKDKKSKTYKFGLWGYSHYRVIAYDLSTGAYYHNYMGELLARTIRNVFPGDRVPEK